MTTFIIRRLLVSIPVFLGITLIVFVFIALAPGDAVSAMIRPEMAADPNAHNVFIVNDAPRKNFAKETTKGITWGEREWHKIRAERDTQAGTYKVFFDDFSKPIMLAEDKTFLKGHIGFGSFDDIGMVTSIKIWGPSAETKRAEFFKKAE